MHAALRAQARSCHALGSDFMGRMLVLLADNWPSHGKIAELCEEWPDDLGPNAASLPLRLVGGLHALVLTSADDALRAAYPPNDVSDQALLDAVLAVMKRQEGFLSDWMQSAPQTNEVRRSAAIIAAAHWVAGKHPQPLMTSELGASAGLNLMWDHYALKVPEGRLGPIKSALTLSPDWNGDIPAAANIEVTDRAGVDLNPLDVKIPEQVTRLLAYLWPDQPHRAELTRAAIGVQSGTVARGDAIDWLSDRLDAQPEGCLHLIYHTVAWQYFPAPAQARGRAMIEAAGAVATESKPLAWFRMESDDDPEGRDGALLSLRLWPGDKHLTLGRADFHGRWIDWNPIET